MPATAKEAKAVELRYQPGQIIENFDPNLLVLAEDKADPLYDKRAFEKDPEVDVLAANMTTSGFTSIIQVLERASFDNPKETEIAVVSGRRRRRAAVIAGVGVTIRFVTSAEAADLIENKVTENVLRKDLSSIALSDELDRWAKAIMAKEDAKFSEAKKYIATSLGRSLRNVNELAELQHLCPAVRKALEANKINMSDVTSRGKGLTQMLDENGDPDVERQEAALVKLLPKDEEEDGKKKKKKSGRSDRVTLGKRDKTNMLASAKVPLAIRTFLLYERGEISQATACNQLGWLTKFYTEQEGPGWEPEGEVEDLEEIEKAFREPAEAEEE